MMRCGIEFEYLLADIAGPTAGRVRDFGNLDYAWLAALLADKPGIGDPSLATGDLGIKSGYWYLEGDERFDADGRFRTLAVKGIEIRTPPAAEVSAAVRELLVIEQLLAERLRPWGLGLGLVGYNPVRTGYQHEPPLNDWERALRRQHSAYDGSRVATMSYGPDVNLSCPTWSLASTCAAARRLAAQAPYLVPFSFSSPFVEGKRWSGCSRRSFERAGRRPLVKVYADPRDATPGSDHRIGLWPARHAGEVGRIEFKAFDAFISADLLQACAQWLVGLCLAADDPVDDPDDGQPVDALLRRAALLGLADRQIRDGALHALDRAREALARHGLWRALSDLHPIEQCLEQRRTPEQTLVAARAAARACGASGHQGLYLLGGLSDQPSAVVNALMARH